MRKMDYSSEQVKRAAKLIKHHILTLETICLRTNTVDDINSAVWAKHLDGLDDEMVLQLINDHIVYNVIPLYYARKDRSFCDEPINYEECFQYAQKKIQHANFQRQLYQLGSSFSFVDEIARVENYSFKKTLKYIELSLSDAAKESVSQDDGLHSNELDIRLGHANAFKLLTKAIKQLIE
jgi:hypothetical protein